MERKVFYSGEENVTSIEDSKLPYITNYSKEFDDDFSEQSSIISNIDAKEPELNTANYCIVEEAKNKSDTDGKSKSQH